MQNEKAGKIEAVRLVLQKPENVSNPTLALQRSSSARSE